MGTAIIGTTPSHAGPLRPMIGPPVSETAPHKNPIAPLTFELRAPEAPSSWQFESSRSDRVKAMRPAMTRKTGELYYSVPVADGVMIKPGVARYKQPRDLYGTTSGRTVIGVAGSIRF